MPRRTDVPDPAWRLPPLPPSLSVFFLLVGIGIGALPTVPTVAQRTTGTVNVGLQVGQPAGVTGKVYRGPRSAYSGLLTTDGDDFVNLYVHRLHERPLPDSLVHLYGGPGLLVGAHRLDEHVPTPGLGPSVQLGLNFYAERFEVFVQATPVLRVLPSVTPEIGGSVGLRYRLRSR